MNDTLAQATDEKNQATPLKDFMSHEQDVHSRTGVVFDARMCLHQANYNHVESPLRIKEMYSVLSSRGVLKRCRHIESREAKEEELKLAHSTEHVNEVQGSARLHFGSDEPDSETDNDPVVYPACHMIDSDTFVCKYSAEAARLSAGCVVELAEQVVKGNIDNGFAIVRPPGHHATPDKAMGFCLYNNVGVAARVVLHKYPSIVRRIAIIDWDVHHGNGTQDMFYEDPSVLYFSVHRYENKTFYPHTGAADETGRGAGVGRNVNMPLPCAQLGDAEYFLVWDELLLPILREFKPDLVIVSAGFDCAQGDPLGGMMVSPAAFAHLTRRLMDTSVTSNGRLILALEGGYNVKAISECAFHCVQALLGDGLPGTQTESCASSNHETSSTQSDRPNSVDSLMGDASGTSRRDDRKRDAKHRLFRQALQSAIKVQTKHWSCFAKPGKKATAAGGSPADCNPRVVEPIQHTPSGSDRTVFATPSPVAAGRGSPTVEASLSAQLASVLSISSPPHDPAGLSKCTADARLSQSTSK